jgi:hypothetical protein
MNPIEQEIERRKNRTQGEPGRRQLDDLEVSELHRQVASGFLQYLGRIPVEERTDHTAEALRLVQIFLKWSQERTSVGWLRYKNAGSSVDNAERLRLALVRAGYEPLKGEDDPLIEENLLEAVARVFEGQYK